MPKARNLLEKIFRSFSKFYWRSKKTMKFDLENKTSLGCCDNEIELKIFCRKCGKVINPKDTMKWIKFAMQTYYDQKENK